MLRDKGKDQNDESVLCGGSYEKVQAVCNQGEIKNSDTEGQVKGKQSMVFRITGWRGEEEHAGQGDQVMARLDR